jgi:hypothetical protein
LEIEKLLTPAIVSAFVTAIIAPLVFFFLKRWDEKNKRNFEIRYAEYKHYLKALEQITSSAQEDFEKFMSEGYAQCLQRILTQEGDSSETLIELSQQVNTLTSNVRKSFIQATQELNGLRLVCSKKLLEVVNEFVELQRQLLEESSAVLSRLNQIDIDNPHSILSGEMRAKGERAEVMFELIVQQMRKELGIK